MVKTLGWEDLETRRKHIRLGMLYKIQNGLIDINSNQYLRSNDSRTRGQHKLYQERITQDVLRNTFFHRTIRDWNQLPPEAITAEGFRDAIRAASLK